jgi:uncharacterized damage-inducible protein DinB
MKKELPIIAPPKANEYAAFYANYIAKVGQENIIKVLIDSQKSTKKLLSTISEQKANYRYADDKWSIKEVLGHMIDVERIMSYRSLRFYRNDKHELAGFDDEEYVRMADFGDRKFADMLKEFGLVRQATLALFEGFNPEKLGRAGIASGYLMSVKALMYVTAGHEIHHIGVINDRYLT